MASKITNEVLEAYLNCKLKGYLKLTGHPGIPSDYTVMQDQARQAVEASAIGEIRVRYHPDDVPSGSRLTAAILGAGPFFAFNLVFEDDLFSLTIAGLKRVDGESELGTFHYIPMLFQEGRRIGKHQRLTLGLFGHVLSQIQGRLPASGVIWHWPDGRITNIRLAQKTQAFEQFLREIKEIAAADSAPKLFLNNHCPTCEFRQRCHDQAIQEDNLSLLRGIGEQEVKGYARKGIFTVTQLSYTFRPRRRPKWAKAAPRPHSFALQALALRENKIYVNGSPHLTNSPIRIFFDIEGLSDPDLYYLIGVLIDDGTTQRSHSFWADSQDDQAQVITQFVQLLTQHANYTLYHWGNYERKALTTLKPLLPDALRPAFDEIQRRAVNVLSTVYASVYVPTLSNTLKHVAAFLVSWGAQNRPRGAP